MVLIFWCFSATPNPTELVSISADGKQWRTRREREKRGEVEKTKQIIRHAAWGGEALQADRLSFIFLPNWGEDFQTPSEAEGIPANREEGRRRRCQSQCETKRLIRPRVYLYPVIGSADNTTTWKCVCLCVHGTQLTVGVKNNIESNLLLWAASSVNHLIFI